MKNGRKINILSVVSPSLSKEWHPTKNVLLTPKNVTDGSSKKVWWLCSNGHEWESIIRNRSKKGSGCPYCAGQKVTPENNFAVHYPEKLKSWHSTKNKALSPLDFLPRSKKQVWWKCDKGHEWKMSFDHRVSLEGCPFCSNRRVSEENNLSVLYPDIAREWHPTKNGKLNPTNVVHGYSKPIWWMCSYGHEWKVSPSARTLNNTGCPKCSIQTSTQEIRVYTELLTIFDDVVQRHKIEWIEVDIYLPKYDICIEYDGSYYHKNKHDEDMEKNNKLSLLGFTVIRVREGLLKIGRNDVITEGVKISKTDIDNLLQGLKTDKKDQIAIETYLKQTKFRGNKEYKKMLSYLPAPPPESSLEELNKYVASEWHFEKNFPLLPRNFTLQSNRRVWWKCDKGHEWMTQIKKRVNGDGCPFCSGKKVGSDNNLSVLKPELVKEWHPTKNLPLKYTEVGKGSHKKVWWICPQKHEWQAVIHSRYRGHDCPTCSINSRVTTGKKITVEGITYPSLSKAAKAYSLNPGTVKSRLKMGWNIKETFGLSVRPKRSAWNAIQVELEGIVYESRSQAATAYKIPLKIVESRLKKGWSPDEAFGIEPRVKVNNKEISNSKSHIN